MNKIQDLYTSDLDKSINLYTRLEWGSNAIRAKDLFQVPDVKGWIPYTCVTIEEILPKIGFKREFSSDSYSYDEYLLKFDRDDFAQLGPDKIIHYYDQTELENYYTLNLIKYLIDKGIFEWDYIKLHRTTFDTESFLIKGKKLV